MGVKLLLKLLMLGLLIIMSFNSFSQSGVVRAIVKNKKTNQIIANAKITLVLNDTITKILETDSDGFFVIKSMTQGKYKLRINVDNYYEEIIKRAFVEDIRTCYLTFSLMPIKS